MSAYIVACSALDPSRDVSHDIKSNLPRACVNSYVLLLFFAQPIRELCSNGDCRQAFGDILMDCDYDRERLDSGE